MRLPIYMCPPEGVALPNGLTPKKRNQGYVAQVDNFFNDWGHSDNYIVNAL